MIATDFVEANELGVTVQARLLDLVSEVGELAKDALEASGYGRQRFQPISLHARQDWQRRLGLRGSARGRQCKIGLPNVHRARADALLARAVLHYEEGVRIEVL